MSSYAYYVRDTPILTDARYDQLCDELDQEWESVSHVHKHLIDREALRSGTGYHVKDYPNTVIGAACHLARIPPRYALASVAQQARPKKTIKFTIIKKKGS